ncbi:TolC family protein [bacterium]|nr:TolC family protein [bacterium]
MNGNRTLRFTHFKYGLICLGLGMVLFGAGEPDAQQYVLSLQDAIDIALEKSYDMKTLRLSLSQAEEGYLAAKYRFRTNIDMEMDVPNWSERVSAVTVPNSLPVYNSFGTLKTQGQLNVNQPLPTSGTLTLSSQLYQSDEKTYLAESDSDLKRKDFLSSLSMQFRQPLFTMNTLKTGLKRAELNYERASRQLSRSQLDNIYNTTQSFFSLYRSLRTYEINSETLEQKKSMYDLAKLKFEAGLIPEVEALQMEVDYAEARANLMSAEANMETQRDNFKQDIGLMLSDEVTVKTDVSFKRFEIDLDKAIKEGLARRAEVREREIELELQKITVRETDARSEFRADLTAFYDLTGVSNPSLSYNSSTNTLFNSSWDDLQRRPRNRGVTLTFSVPIWDWGVNKAEVASAQAVLKRNELSVEEQKKTVESSIRDAVRRVTEAVSRLEVLQKSQEVAQRSYDISLERFNNGEITSQDLALDNNRLSQSKMAYLNAYITFQLATADLKRKTLWDFENNQPIE